MKFYYYQKTGIRGWDFMPNGIELNERSIDAVDSTSVIFIHWSDFSPASKPSTGTLWSRFGQKVSVGSYREIVFFTGGDYVKTENGTRVLYDDSKLRVALSEKFCAKQVRAFLFPETVDSTRDGAKDKFAKYVQLLAGGETLWACDFFSAQARELKTAFRLLVQFWLVEEGLFTLSGVPAKKNQKSTKDPNFWTPVKSGDDSYSKLREALELEECPKGGDLHLPPKNEDAPKWLKWAFAVEQSVVKSK